MSLNPRQQKFAELIVKGSTAKAAYFESFPRCKSEKTAEVEGCKLSKNPKVVEFIEALRWEITEKVKSEEIASREEVAKFLTDVIRTPAGMIDEENPLCQSFKHTKAENSIRMPDKIKAAERLSKIMGYDQPEKVEVSGDLVTGLLTRIRAGKKK